MEENKGLNIPEDPEEYTAEESVPVEEEPEAEEKTEVAEEAEVEQSQVLENPEPEETTYRGIGSGRKESPFADSPYVMNHSHDQNEPESVSSRESEEDHVPAPKKSERRGGTGRRILAVIAVLALVVGSCGITASLVNDRWERRVSAMEQYFGQQIQTLSQKVDTLSPQNTGISVSGTADAVNGLTAGQVYARNVHSVVLIESTVVASMYGQTATGVSSGSGFILTEDGYVITNYHVIEGASSVAVGLYDGTRHQAAVVGYDSTNDIALLKLNVSGLDAVELGSSSDLIVGDQVVAIGNPLGELTATLTVGYVSAKERTISTDGTIINMIQTDAAINSGNSGGPLFNMKGQVVGITTAKYSGASSSGATIEGIGFAIPIDDILEEIEELKEFGYIKSAYLGVLVQNMASDVADLYGLPVGAYVVGVEDGYCAQRSGIQAKDIIIAVGDEKIKTIADLTRALRAYEPGDMAQITIFRAGQTKVLKVVLDERPAGTGTTTTLPEPEG